MSNGMAPNNVKKKSVPDRQQVWELTILTELPGSGYLGTVSALRCADMLLNKI